MTVNTHIPTSKRNLNVNVTLRRFFIQENHKQVPGNTFVIHGGTQVTKSCHKSTYSHKTQLSGQRLSQKE